MSSTNHYRERALFSCLVILLLCCAPGAVVGQNILTVNTLEDQLDTPAGSELSLREALRDAKAGDKIMFQTGLTGSIALTRGTIIIDSSCTIEGPGSSELELNGLHEFGIFSIPALNPGITLSISGLTFANARSDTGACIFSEHPLALTGCAFRTSLAVSHGGAVYHASGDLTVSNCRFEQCTSYSDGGALYANGGALTFSDTWFGDNSSLRMGGALYTGSGVTTLDLTQCKFEGNSSVGDGGAVCLQGISSDVEFNICELTANFSEANGGAISASGCTSVWMDECSASGNGASLYGGALYGKDCSFSIETCLFSANMASVSGGAWSFVRTATSTATDMQAQDCILEGNVSRGSGGALHFGSLTSTSMERCSLYENIADDGAAAHVTGSCDMTLCTINENEADMSGGAIYLDASAASLSMDHCTVTDNAASQAGAVMIAVGSFTPSSSILAGNGSDTGGDVYGTVSSGGYNLVGQITDSTGWITTDILPGYGEEIDPMLDPLSENGGLTPTCALQACSPAVDSGEPTTAAITDQRGLNGNKDGNGDNVAAPDIGAYEAQSVLDTEDPVIVTYDGVREVLLDGTGSALIDLADLVLYMSDNCGIVDTLITPSELNCSDTDTVTVTITATDFSGNSKSATVYVRVFDPHYPVITAPTTVDAALPANRCSLDSAEVITSLPTVSDNCANVTLTSTEIDEFHIGTTYLIWTATDAHGNSTSAVQQVTLRDVTPPVLGSLPPLSKPLLPGACTLDRASASLGIPTITDFCDNVPTLVNDAPLAFPPGVTTVTWTGKDRSGNTATTTQLVTVTDPIAPTIVAPDDIVVAVGTGKCSRDLGSIVLGIPAVSDNCPDYTITTIPSQDPLPLGINTVTWTVTDKSGNQASSVQQVTVVDNEPPTITAPPDKVFDTDPGKCYWTVIPAELGTATTGDNCPSGVSSASNNAGTQLGIGIHSVVWWVMDAEGHTSYDVQIVRVNGELEFVPHANITTNTDPGMPGAIVYYSDPVGTTECDGVEVVRTGGLGSGSFFPVGTTTETFKMFDVNGNEETCNFTVTVTDNESPVLLVRIAPMYLWPVNNSLRSVTATVEIWDNVPGASAVLSSITCNQNANGDIVDASLGVFDELFSLRASRGSNSDRVYTVTYTATDLASNSATATATVTVPQHKPKDYVDDDLPVPEGVVLSQNYPNPFNPSTTISFGLPEAAHAQLRVYNSMGSLIRVLADRQLDEGTYYVNWDGHDSMGLPAPSGVYITVLRVGDVQLKRNMILVR